jgi:hypothetical protein
MDIDERTRLRSEYVRMRIACKNVRQVPAIAEGTLGLKIYDFQFEREVMEEPEVDRLKAGVKSTGHATQPSPKKARTMEGSGPVTNNTQATQNERGTPDVSAGSNVRSHGNKSVNTAAKVCCKGENYEGVGKKHNEKEGIAMTTGEDEKGL